MVGMEFELMYLQMLLICTFTKEVLAAPIFPTAITPAWKSDMLCSGFLGSNITILVLSRITKYTMTVSTRSNNTARP
jgi:uncharacterized membrane protein (DUF485 family)